MEFWQSYFDFINSSELIRAIAVIAVIFIMYKMNIEPAFIIRSILLITVGVFGFWFLSNLDYIVYSIFR